MRILVVEDNADLASGLREALTADGHAVDVAEDGLTGEDLIRSYPYDLAILDVMLPGQSGLELCRAARRSGLATPVLMLTARDTLEDKVTGLDAGADDYLVKPFELPEFRARVRALLRRATPSREAVLSVGDLRFDLATHEITRAGVPLKLSKKERALLEVLMRHAGSVVPHELILERLYDADAEPSQELVRAHVKGLRKAIGDTGEPRLIETVHGIGYRMTSHVPAS